MLERGIVLRAGLSEGLVRAMSLGLDSQRGLLHSAQSEFN